VLSIGICQLYKQVGHLVTDRQHTLDKMRGHIEAAVRLVIIALLQGARDVGAQAVQKQSQERRNCRISSLERVLRATAAQLVDQLLQPLQCARGGARFVRIGMEFDDDSVQLAPQLFERPLTILDVGLLIAWDAGLVIFLFGLGHMDLSLQLAHAALHRTIVQKRALFPIRFLATTRQGDVLRHRRCIRSGRANSILRRSLRLRVSECLSGSATGGTPKQGDQSTPSNNP
jgi:hypothetical protein